MRYGTVDHFINTPTINVSDEVVDFDGIDLVSDEEPDLDDDNEYEDC